MFGLATNPAILRPLAGDLRQLASVRRIVLDDGPERGVRALAFSTGAGLDFWALSDRSLDIGPLWFRGTPVAWQGPAGFVSPAVTNTQDDDRRGLERSFSGLLVTCGLDHIRKPPQGLLHGHLPFTPARLTAYGEDWNRSDPFLFCEGQITQSRLNGEALRVHRRIEAPIGTTILRIHDRIENLGAEPQRLALLYHLNLGFPALQDASKLTLNDSYPVDLTSPGPQCFPTGQAQARITLTSPIPQSSFMTIVTFGASSLPFLQVWRNPSPATHILSIEPCTSMRLADGRSGPEPYLDPGAQRDFHLEIAFVPG